MYMYVCMCIYTYKSLQLFVSRSSCGTPTSVSVLLAMSSVGTAQASEAPAFLPAGPVSLPLLGPSLPRASPPSGDMCGCRRCGCKALSATSVLQGCDTRGTEQHD